MTRIAKENVGLIVRGRERLGRCKTMPYPAPVMKATLPVKA